MNAQEFLITFERRGFKFRLSPKGGFAIAPTFGLTADDRANLKLQAAPLERLLREREARPREISPADRRTIDQVRETFDVEQPIELRDPQPRQQSPIDQPIERKKSRTHNWPPPIDNPPGAETELPEYIEEEFLREPEHILPSSLPDDEPESNDREAAVLQPPPINRRSLKQPIRSSRECARRCSYRCLNPERSTCANCGAPLDSALASEPIASSPEQAAPSDADRMSASEPPVSAAESDDPSAVDDRLVKVFDMRHPNLRSLPSKSKLDYMHVVGRQVRRNYRCHQIEMQDAAPNSPRDGRLEEDRR
jgi:hypothetical protein